MKKSLLWNWGQGLGGWSVRVVLLLVVLEQGMSQVTGQSPPSSSGAIECPLNFTVLDLYPYVADNVKRVNAEDIQCTAARAGLEMVLAVYLRETGYFLPPSGSADPCYAAYEVQLVKQGLPSTFNLSQICPVQQFHLDRTDDICQGVQNVSDWNAVVPVAQLTDVNASCAGSLENTANCGVCSTAQTRMASAVQSVRITNNTVGCQNFTKAFVAGVVNIPGPLDPGTALCILYISPPGDGGSNAHLAYIALGVGAILLLSLIGAAIMLWRYRRRQQEKKAARQRRNMELMEKTTKPNSTVFMYSLEDLKKATGNFSNENLLGTGGYGNVYKGTLADGEVVAIKRFKNCSPAGDRDFVHEAEIISSVRHKHLVAIRGCCVDGGGVLDGHQRLIVFDYMPNGSLQDHLFPKRGGPILDWALRTRIAIGTAKGLAYLHYDALPSIIHRDIKPSNILLDSEFNARLADFGLAKYSPEGVSHLTTKVAGTYGYVAPEYALYGQLTDKSDVYSFGMVLLELVTGRRALVTTSDDHPPILLSDYVWPFVKQGNWKSVIDPNVTDVVADEVMERFILTGLLCAHPQVYYRPSIDQALKMLESDVAVPEIPDRPLPLTSNMAEIEAALGHSAGSSYSSGSMSRRSLLVPPPKSPKSYQSLAEDEPSACELSTQPMTENVSSPSKSPAQSSSAVASKTS